MYQEARANFASENWQKSALFRKAIEPLQTRCVPEMHIKIKQAAVSRTLDNISACHVQDRKEAFVKKYVVI